GLYVMIFNAHKDRIREIKKQVQKLLASHAKSGFESDEVEAIKARIVDAVYRSFDDLNERNEFIASREIYGQKDFTIEKDIESIRKVTPKRLKYLLNKMLDRPSGQVTVMPKKSSGA